MRTRTRLLTAAAALAATGSFIVGTGPAAMAQRAAATCPGEVICLYTQDNYGGKMQAFSGNHTSLGTFNNSANSMKNNTGYSYKLYSGKSYSGTSYTAKHDSIDGDFSNNAIGDDNAESIKRG